MLKNIFQLAVTFINRLAYSRKFVLVTTVAVIPVIILTYQLASKLGADIDFARKEQKGVAYLLPTLNLLQHVQQHRGAANTFLSGDATFKDIMTQKNVLIVEDIAAINSMEQAYGVDLQSGERWLEIKDEWQSLQNEVDTLTATESFDRHTALIDKIFCIPYLHRRQIQLVFRPEYRYLFSYDFGGEIVPTNG